MGDKRLPETEEGKLLYIRLQEFLKTSKNSGDVKKAKRVILEFETGFGNERMFIAGAHRLLDDE
jgi:hypothetical protein